MGKNVIAINLNQNTMQKSKLFTFLQQLTKKEQKNLSDYFCQPYYSQKHPQLGKLLQYLLQHLNTPEKAAPQTVFGLVFPGLPYNDLKLRHLAAEALQHAEEALAAQNSISDRYYLQLQLMEIYRSRKMVKHYEGVSNSLQTLFNRDEQRNAEYYRYHYLFWRNKDLFTENRNQPEKQTYLANASDALDVFYLSSKLRMAAEMITLKKVVDSPHQMQLLTELLQMVQQGIWLQYPVIAVYFHIVMTLTEPDNPAHFDSLNHLFATQNSKLTTAEAREVYYFLLNYCATKINSGQTKFLHQIFDLYQIGLNTQLLLEGHHLSPWNYKNIVTAALRLGNYSWVYDFLHQYRSFLPPKHQKNAFTYNLANYYFFNKDYPRVLQLLQEVSYDEVFYSLDARSLLLKTYFELDEYEALQSLIDSFRQWLNRTKELSKPRQQTYRNLLYFVRKLIQLPYEKPEKRAALLAEIKNTPAIADKRWLLQQIEGNG
ncbi:hypothetical protein C7N43_30105 [Sphingobacteriales bacterium UPWRP_1]|nr:hypothetical protein B6N25_17155 [Sphingobacteriales bacterium TSM_CSS]PSJ73260.1 hypothetical protein C7N43_30105 [Sphingobacteriales bacterium UPWRP_1]